MTTEPLIRTAHKQSTLVLDVSPLSIPDLKEEATIRVTCDDDIVEKDSVIIPCYSCGEKDSLGSKGLCNNNIGDYIDRNNTTNSNFNNNNSKYLISDDSDNTHIQPSQVFRANTTRIDHCADSDSVNISYRLNSYEYQITKVTTDKESDKHMITLGKFYTLVKKTLDLRRFPKSKVKSTGLAIYPEKGNYRHWYYGVKHIVDGEEKVNLIPYLSGESVPLETRKSIEVKEEDCNDEENSSLSTIGQLGEKVDNIHLINIGTIEDVFAFTFPMPNVVNLPIKQIGEEFYIPVEYMGMVEALQKIVDYEKSINSNFTEYYAYITVDNSVHSRDLSVLTNESEHTTIERFQIYYGEVYQVFVTSTELPYLTVTFTTDKLNTIGNGINPLVPEKWTYQPCEVIER